jgi:coenzyme PQQ synthesis protein D (PqqD)
MSLYVARSTAAAARGVGEETMIMSAADSTLFTLNEVASLIWEAADGVTPLEEIVANKICAQYDVTSEVALKDAEALVKGLAEHGIIVLSDRPLAPSSRSRQGE